MLRMILSHYSKNWGCFSIYIAKALIVSDCHGRDEFRIVTERLQEDHANNTIYYGLPLADEIMKAYACDKNEFECNRVKYSLLEYICNAMEKKYNPHHKVKVDFTMLSRPQAIYINKDHCTCMKCLKKYGYDSIENRNALVNSIDKINLVILIDVQFCTRCRRYFIDQESLKTYEKKYGILLFERNYELPDAEDYGDGFMFNDNTVLSKYGYSAGQNHPTGEVRRHIIAMLLESGISSKHEIKGILSGFICLRGDRCKYAVEIWKADLAFVNDYNAENQNTYANFFLTWKYRSYPK